MASLWQRLGRVFARGDAGAREEAERILLEADFGVAATAEILEQVARTPDGDRRTARLGTDCLLRRSAIDYVKFVTGAEDDRAIGYLSGA